MLVTAGPTRVMIDAVRHIGNFSSGRTGFAIARHLRERGADVTLLLGPGRVSREEAEQAGLRVLEITTFDDLHRAVREQVGSRAFDAMIHAAAVSDFRPVREERGKLSSGAEELTLVLQPTPKIVDEVKALDPLLLLVKFKLEVGRTRTELLEIARRSRAQSDAELIVANDLTQLQGGRHPALLLDMCGLVAEVDTTAALAERLAEELAARLRALPPRSVALPPLPAALHGKGG